MARAAAVGMKNHHHAVQVDQIRPMNKTARLVAILLKKEEKDRVTADAVDLNNKNY